MHYPNKQTLLNMNYTFVFPYLCYAVEIWDKYLAPSEPIFQSLNVLNFEKL